MKALLRMTKVAHYPQRIAYQVSALVQWCLEGLAPLATWKFAAPLWLSSIMALYSAVQVELLVPHAQTAIRQQPCLLCLWPSNLEWAPSSAVPDPN